MTNQKIVTFLTFNNKAEEAVNFYCSVFKNSAIKNITRYPAHVPELGGKFISASFELEGQTFYALNGGNYFTFSQGISLFVNCQTQAEVDELWDKLSEYGEELSCGWLKDKFGISWQIIPTVLGQLLGDIDPHKAGNVMNAMLKMKKINIAALQDAYNT